MGKTFAEWVALYNKKTPEPYKRDERFELFYDAEHGFCEVGQSGKFLIINQLAGDGRFWKEKVSAAARAAGIRICGTWCIRKGIRAYIRLFGYHIDHTEDAGGGLLRYFCKDKDGRTGLCSPSFRYEDGTQAYFITWEV